MESKQILLGEKVLKSLAHSRKKFYLKLSFNFLPMCSVILIDFWLYSKQLHIFLLIISIVILTISGWIIIFLYTTKIQEINKRISLINRSKKMDSRIITGKVKSITKEIYTIQKLSCKQVNVDVNTDEICLYSLEDFDINVLVGEKCRFILYFNIIFEYYRGDSDE